MFARVVVGADVTRASEGAIACVGALRGLGTREVVLVHALGLRHLAEMAPALAPLVEPPLEARRRAIERLGVTASLEIAPGAPAAELARISNERSASLVVLGAESSRARECLVGSVAVQLLHHSELPVLLPGTECTRVAGGPEQCERSDLRRHVLYATDLSGTSERALGVVEDIVRAGARCVTLVHVQDPAADRGALEHLRKRLLLVGADEVRIETPTGSPVEAIVRTATTSHVSLVVMGTSGRSSARELYLGSVSHGVARGAAAPVLLVPPRREWS